MTAVVTGKPINIGGSRGRREATGRGVLMVCDQAIKKLGLNRNTTRVIVQGFGNVGSNAARLMAQSGYKVIGIVEVGGGLYKKDGIDMEALWAFRRARGHDPRLPRGREVRSGGTFADRVRHLDSGGNGKSDYQPECGSGEVQDSRRGREWSDDRGRRRRFSPRRRSL